MAVSLVRLRTLFAIFAIASLLLAGRLAYWQTIGRGELLGQATDQTRTDLVLAAQRGVVRDRSGAILATTVELRSLYAIPRRIADRGAAAAALAPILGQSAEAIRAALDSGAEWLYLRRRLPEDVARRIAALRIEGLGFENEPKRLYPNGALGAHVLGFVNDDGQGQYGVEGRYDPILRGVDGRLVVERDPANRELAIGLRIATDPRRGQDLVLTVDLAVQTAVERELAAAIARERATSGSAIVLDPHDGAILALASWPPYDPARVATADAEALRDRAVSWAYEPGSTMKAITIAAALDKRVVTPQTTYDDKGFAIIGGRRLGEAPGGADGPAPLTQRPARPAERGAGFRARRRRSAGSSRPTSPRPSAGCSCRRSTTGSRTARRSRGTASRGRPAPRRSRARMAATSTTRTSRPSPDSSPRRIPGWSSSSSSSGLSRSFSERSPRWTRSAGSRSMPCATRASRQTGPEPFWGPGGRAPRLLPSTERVHPPAAARGDGGSGHPRHAASRRAVRRWRVRFPHRAARLRVLRPARPARRARLRRGRLRAGRARGRRRATGRGSPGRRACRRGHRRAPRPAPSRRRAPRRAPDPRCRDHRQRREDDHEGGDRRGARRAPSRAADRRFVQQRDRRPAHVPPDGADARGRRHRDRLLRPR